MKWTIENVNNEYWLITTSGTFDLEGQRGMVRDVLSRGDWKPGMKTLFDHRALDLSASSYTTMSSAAGVHIAHEADIGNSRTAIVVANQVAMGRVRQFMGITGVRVSARIWVFYDYDEARTWLLE